MITFITGPRAIGKTTKLVPAFRDYYRNANVDIHDLDNCPARTSKDKEGYYNHFLSTVLDFWGELYLKKYYYEDGSLIVIGHIFPEPLLRKTKELGIIDYNLIYLTIDEAAHLPRIQSRSNEEKEIKFHLENTRELHEAIGKSQRDLPMINISEKSPQEIISEIEKIAVIID